MAKVRIYRFRGYDIQRDAVVTSRRWGTAEAIRDIAGGQVLEGTGIEVDESVIHSDIHGFTAVDFNPRAE